MRGIGDNPNDMALVSAIIAMAESLQLNVLAEGVENQDQVNFLVERAASLHRAPITASQCRPRMSSNCCRRQTAPCRPDRFPLVAVSWKPGCALPFAIKPAAADGIALGDRGARAPTHSIPVLLCDPDQDDQAI